MNQDPSEPGRHEPELARLEALPAPEREKHLLGAYDRLRSRVIDSFEKKGHPLGADALRVLLLVPDIFLLLVRLALDKEVPRGTRALIGSVLAYFLLPLDLFPEGLFGAAGFLDDLVLATALLSQVFGGELEPHARRHWSGPDDLREVLRDVSDTAHRLLGHKRRQRIEKLLEKKGLKAPLTDEDDREG
ncbi:MAG TPA: DUF1232 domain-containing protein [Thermoanaerobaculia bacterium]|nr:DUF1232 domain-containing protein [Thermoanaerobaculia bacterium]